MRHENEDKLKSVCPRKTFQTEPALKMQHLATPQHLGHVVSSVSSFSMETSVFDTTNLCKLITGLLDN